MTWGAVGAISGAAAGLGAGYLQKKGGEASAKAQEEANKRSQAFIEQQARRARSDVTNLYPIILSALLGGNTGAWDVMQTAYPQQIDVMRKGNLKAQEALLGGLDAQQQAILGQPINYSGLKVRNPAKGAAGIFSGLQGPQGIDPAALEMALSGYNITPGETTNADIVSQAFLSGNIDEPTYNLFQRHFAQGGNPAGTVWGSRDPSTLISRIGPESSKEWRANLSTLFGTLPRTQ